MRDLSCAIALGMLAASCAGASEPRGESPRTSRSEVEASGALRAGAPPRGGAQPRGGAPPAAPRVAEPPALADAVSPPVAAPLPPPIPLAERGRVTQLAAGTGHTCALHDSGRVSCWGRDRDGQLGDGDAIAPGGTIVLVAGLDDAAHIAASQAHTCAVRRGGTVVCWGSSAMGETADAEGRRASSAPEPVEGLVDAVEVAAGAFYSCARLRSGAVSCWGRRRFGNYYGLEPPTLVEGIVDAAQIVARPRSLLVRSTSGEVREHLRRGSHVFEPSGAHDIAALGEDHACLIDERRRVRCWAMNRNAGPEGSRRRTGYSDVAVAAHACAIRAGRVYCWGPDEEGRTGAATRVTYLDDADRAHRVPIDDAVQVVVGARHSCALRSNGAVECWGSNRGGELGAPPPPAITGGYVHGIDDAVDVDGTCAALADGTARCWGRGDVPLPPLRGVVAIATRELEACAIVTGGRVTCWYQEPGRNGPRTHSWTRAGVRGVTRLSLGPEMAGVLTSRGEVFSFPDGRARRLVGVGPVRDVACAGSECCVVEAEGTVSCWGDDFDVIGCSDCGHDGRPLHRLDGLTNVVRLIGQFGDLCATQESGQVQCWEAWRWRADRDAGTAPAPVEGAEDMIEARPFGGVTRDGRVRYFGRDTPTDAASIEGAVQLSRDECARLRDGRVTCWGEPSAYREDAFGAELPWSATPREVIAGLGPPRAE